ncbi:AhpC/TSA family protein [Gracilibacillus orientalis]|uniref:AhpC/TSA family protein n=1 Tax=Gracilibacillus orientalis TaxID=334253 RepID=A0A1I4Q9Z0_9BACI|nr:redoxin domain-containing protein [Gracilibacillus orientalis]SFM36912.1 AhpC/TSA family protein [Gracilibacillus orientalis]
MWKSILSAMVVLILVGIVVITNFTNIGDEQLNPNVIDVTEDTSVDGVGITAPNIEQLEVGDQAPSFRLADLTGSEVEAFNVEQDYVLLNFWATWCKPCLKEMPDMQTFEDENKDSIKVIAVNTTNRETSIDKVETFVDEGDFQFTILLDEEDIVYEHYSIIGMPTSFIIRTSDQKIMKRINGAMTLEQMEDHLKELQS